MLKGENLGLPYIKVKYKADDPGTGHKKGEVHTLAYRTFDEVPADMQDLVELEEGAADAKELKLVQIEKLQRDIDNKKLQIDKLKAQYEHGEEEEEEEYEEEEVEESEEETDDPAKPGEKKKVVKKTAKKKPKR